MVSRVDSFFETPIPSEVWHYTNLAGFEGIVSSGSIWATEAHFTTDTTEFIHAHDVARAVLDAFHPTDYWGNRAKEICAETVNHAFDIGPLSPSRSQTFVASFSDAEDLLSQWYRYADNGSGVSLGFSLSRLRPPRDLESAVTLAPCVYLPQQKEELVQSALSHVLDTAQLGRDSAWNQTRIAHWCQVQYAFGLGLDPEGLKKWLANQIAAALDAALGHLYIDLLKSASHCKNYAFHEEREWRLALPHRKGAAWHNNRVEYRGQSAQMPYVAVKNLFSGRLPITRVILGPNCRELDRVTRILANFEYAVPVVQSRIPVRPTEGWS